METNIIHKFMQHWH